MALLQTTMQPPRSSGGDGGYQPNGMMRVPRSAAPVPNTTPTFQTHRPPPPQTIPGQGQAPQTFAQMQAAGQARPAPPQVAQPEPAQLPGMVQGALVPPSGASMGVNAPGGVNLPQSVSPYSGPANPGLTPPTSVNPSPTVGSYTGPAADGSTPAPPPLGVADQLQTAVGSALNQPSRYDMPQVQQVRDALTNQLNTQFGAQQKALDENMASRGVGSSSIASGYYGDLAGQQANALGSMNAQLTQDFANTQAQDRTSALGSGLNLQQLLMGNQTSNRGLDITQQNNNNNYLLQLEQLLGLPTGSTDATSTTGATDPNAAINAYLQKMGINVGGA